WPDARGQESDRFDKLLCGGAGVCPCEPGARCRLRGGGLRAIILCHQPRDVARRAEPTGAVPAGVEKSVSAACNFALSRKRQAAKTRLVWSKHMVSPSTAPTVNRPVLLLTEDDVRQLLTMDLALEAVERGLRKMALDEVSNVPRTRAQTDHCML